MQFRELEFLSGAKDPTVLVRLRDLTDDERARLERRLAEPTLWDAFLTVLSQAGLGTENEEEVRASLLTVARDRATYDEIWELSERLLDHDEMAARWRARHVLMVERQIGTKSGTGGSTGAPYLRSRLGLTTSRSFGNCEVGCDIEDDGRRATDDEAGRPRGNEGGIAGAGGRGGRAHGGEQSRERARRSCGATTCTSRRRTSSGATRWTSTARRCRTSSWPRRARRALRGCVFTPHPRRAGLVVGAHGGRGRHRRHAVPGRLRHRGAESTGPHRSTW